MRAVGRKVIAKALDRDAVETAGGLILPQIATKDDWFGEVVAVGPDVKSVKPGDIIVAPIYTAVEFASFDRGETYRAYHEDNILAVFDREEVLGG
jgi:co-chaperonin GroES (HSP10)